MATYRRRGAALVDVAGHPPLSGRPEMTRRVSLVDRVAMELRQIEAEEAAAMSGNRYDRRAAETWDRAGEPLRTGYRRDARRLIRIIRARLEDDGL